MTKMDGFRAAVAAMKRDLPPENVVDLAMYRKRREWNNWIASQPIKPRDNGGDDDRAA